MKKLLLITLMIVALPVAAQSLRRDMLVSADWLAENLDNVILVDVGEKAEYDAAHIPGARFMERAQLVTVRNGIPNELPDVADLEAVFTQAGIGNRGRIVLYGRDQLVAARAWFTLDYLGHGSRTAILDGGLPHWMALGNPVSNETAAVEPVPLQARVNQNAVTPFKAVRELVRFLEVMGDSLVIIDARSPVQFRGKEPGRDIGRAGHIPGAVNVAWDENFTLGDIPRFLPERELRDLYKDAKVSSQSTNVVYCRTGMEASVTYFVLRYLGYDASLYDGSYYEWNRQEAVPVAK